MIRALQSVDLLKLPFSELRKLPNYAKPRNRIGSANLSILALFPFQYWLGFYGQRRTWVEAQRFRIRGLVSTRSRRGASVWEIDQLVFLPDSLQEEMNVLHSLALGAGRRGVDRVFLRLTTDCPYAGGIHAAGFSFYGQERLYIYENPERGRRDITGPSPLGLDTKSSADEYGVFQLFNSAFPLHVREAEGQTLNEWRDVHHSWANRRSKEYICRRNGAIVGWIRVSGNKKSGHLEVISRPNAGTEEGLVEAGLHLLNRSSKVYCLASEYQAPLGSVLENKGFKLAEEYAAAVRYITARVKRPSLVPIGVK